VQISDGGFSWGDAGIGAAGTLGLIALIGGTGLLVGQRRRERHPATS
jgi:LPXTG-motif cell wall-anchored protein